MPGVSTSTRCWPKRRPPSARARAGHAAYEPLYRKYLRLHDLVGRGGNDVMQRLKAIQLAAGEAAG